MQILISSIACCDRTDTREAEADFCADETVVISCCCLIEKEWVALEVGNADTT